MLSWAYQGDEPIRVGADIPPFLTSVSYAGTGTSVSDRDWSSSVQDVDPAGQSAPLTSSPSMAEQPSIDTATESPPAAVVRAEESPLSPQQQSPQEQSPPQPGSGSPPGELHCNFSTCSSMR